MNTQIRLLALILAFTGLGIGLSSSKEVSARRPKAQDRPLRCTKEALAARSEMTS